MESGGRSSITQRAGGAGIDAGSTRVKPLYKRLPHGPHRLDRDEVILHQRARIHGAMVEAVAECGYEGTSVKQVIGLAGVSRRSFYEQFANKQESFLATFDLLAHQAAQRARRAYQAGEGGLEDRLRRTFQALDQATREDPKPAQLVLVEAQTAGVAGALRLCRATATCEQMLAKSFAEGPDAMPLPTPIARSIAGGISGSIANVIRTGTLEQRPDLAEELLRWTMLYQTPAATQMAKRMAPQLTKRMREISCSNANASSTAIAPDADDRERLLQTVLRLAAMHDYRELTAPQIAEEARVSIDAFLEYFTDRDECFLAALDMVSDDLLAITADPGLISSDWPHAVRRTMGQLMHYLANHPLYARTITQDAFFAGSEAVTRDLELARNIAVLLTEGAPVPATNPLTIEGITGALWHTVRYQVAAGRVQLLGALSDYLSYTVLTPFIGADAAIEIVAEEQPA
jgi:TetR/AcrR family transcriptional regulator